MDVKVINDELAACCLLRELGHAIKIDQERYEDLVCGRAVFEDSEKIGLEGDSRYIASMKREGRGRCCERYTGREGEGWPNGAVGITL